MNKVYCSECKYFYKDFLTFQEECKHPNNWKETYWSRHGVRKWTPESQNKDNNCPFYKEK